MNARHTAENDARAQDDRWRRDHMLAHEGHWVMPGLCITCGVRRSPEDRVIPPGADQ